MGGHCWVLDTHLCTTLGMLISARHAGADQDSVRLLAVQCCGALARTLSKAECLATVVPVVQRFAQVMLPSH